MKHWLLIFALITLNCSAQQEPQFSQNMYNILPVNPGYAGSSDAICATVLYRNQWVGFIGAPKTMLFTVEGPVKFLRGGLGLTVVSDKLGADKTTRVKLAYAYKIDIGPGQLGIGIQGGIINKTLDGSQFNSFIPKEQDNTIPNNNESDMTTNFAFGLYYNTDILYVGISSSQLLEPEVSYPLGDIDNSAVDIKLKRHYYLTAGYTIRLTPSLELIPSVWLKSDGTTVQGDINAVAMYNNQFWGGITYRLQDAVVPLIGFQWNNIKIGYSYDITTSDIKGYSSGTHEIMLGYCFKMPENKSAQRYRNVRFL